MYWHRDFLDMQNINDFIVAMIWMSLLIPLGDGIDCINLNSCSPAPARVPRVGISPASGQWLTCQLYLSFSGVLSCIPKCDQVNWRRVNFINKQIVRRDYCLMDIQFIGFPKHFQIYGYVFQDFFCFKDEIFNFFPGPFEF